MDDNHYIELVQENDQNALGVLYDRYFDRVLAYAYRRTFDKQIAYDITANVFMSVAKKIKKFKPVHQNSFAGWLFRIASNEVIDYYRKPEKYVSSVAFNEEDIKDLEDNSGELLDTLELYIQLHNAMQELPLKEQLVVDLYYFENMSYKDIAVSTGLKENNIGVLLHRSIKKLKSKLEPFEGIKLEGELS